MTIDITPEKIAELRTIAEKATPGPWKWTFKMWVDGGVELVARFFKPDLFLNHNHPANTPEGKQACANYDFIATFNPTLVLQLLDFAEIGTRHVNKT